ncbi:MAG: energy transducer TonB [Alteraurantiacibacter sp.]
MSYNRLIVLAALALPGVAQPAFAQDRKVLLPSSNWELHYDTDSCVLRRGFGGEGEGIFFELRQFAPGVSYQLLVVSGDFAVRDDSPTLRYGSDTDTFAPGNALVVEYDNGVEGVILNDNMFPAATKAEIQELDEEERASRYRSMMLDKAALSARESVVNSITLGDVFGEDITLKTGDMRAPMDAMRACTDDMVTRWGFDPAIQKTLSRPAMPRNSHRLARRVQENYPRSMRTSGTTARVQIRLDIDAQGYVSGCHFQLPVKQEAFRNDACNSLKLARFEPAHDADGNPIASYWSSAISYLLD